MQLFKLVINIIALALLSVGGFETFSQVDPSSALLLRSNGKAPTKDDLDSSRYRVRQSPNNTPDDRRLQSSPVPSSRPVRVVAPKNPTIKTSVAEDIHGPDEKKSEESGEVDKTSDLTETMQEILIGGTLKNITEYRQLLDKNDYRLNIVDLSIEPMYIYNSSNSNFWLREYNTSSPGVKLAADIWITPFFGFHTSYQTSLNASIKTSFTDPGKTPVDHEWFRGGIRFRKFFGVSRESSGLAFGIDFSEYQMKIESSTMNRVGVKSTGVNLSFGAIVPMNPHHQWNLGVHIIPRLDHKHIETGISAQSGDNQESTGFGVSVGSRFVFSRKSQIYWKVSHEVEKNLFDGQSSINDARSGAQITGVDVTNSFTIFSVGYTWGN